MKNSLGNLERESKDVLIHGKVLVSLTSNAFSFFKCSENAFKPNVDEGRSVEY